LSDRIPVLCLGSGAALGDGRLWSSLLIDGRILLDLPPTAIPQLHRLGQDASAIDYVFISHLHADHLFGAPFLLLKYCMIYERSRPLYFVGPGGLSKTVKALCALAWPDMERQGFLPRVPLSYVELEGEGTYSAGDLAFDAFPMQHFELSAFGYRFEYRGRTFAYSGDTRECPELTRLIGGADVAILEMTYARQPGDPGHLDAESVRRTTDALRRSGATVLATHLGPEPPPPIDGLTVCEDGTTYWV